MRSSEYGDSLSSLGNLLIYLHKLGLNKNLKKYGVFQ